MVIKLEYKGSFWMLGIIFCLGDKVDKGFEVGVFIFYVKRGNWS